MKLHLPKNLRSALLSAVLAVSAASPSFAAVTPWVIQNWNGYNETAQSVTVGRDSTTGKTNVIDIALDQNWNTNWSFFFTVDAASLKNEDGTKLLTLLGIKMQKSNGDTYLAEGATMSNNSNNLTLTVWSKDGGDAGSISIPDEGDITFVLRRQGDNADNLSLAVYGSATSTTPITTLYSSAAQDFTGIVSGVVFGGKGNDTYKADNANHATFAPDHTVDSYAIKKAGYSFGSTDIAADVTTFNNILTWDGGAENNWSSASWSKNGTPGQTCTANDSVIFATEGASVTIDSSTSVAAATIGKDTTFQLSGSNTVLTVTNLTLEGGKTLTVDGRGELEVTTLGTYVGDSAGIVHAKNGASVKLVGTKIANTTVEGNLILGGGGSVTLSGTVTLDSVDNDLTYGGTNHYAFVGSGTVNLTFTGTSDLTKTTGGQSNNNSKIGLDQNSSITIAAGASLTTSAILYSATDTEDTNASLTVQKSDKEDQGEDLWDLYLSGDSYVRSLDNAGKIESTAKIGSYRNITNTGTLKAGTLEINHAANYTTSSLGGTVEVGRLILNRGTAKVTKDGALTVKTSIQGGTIDATASDSDSPVTFKGTTITNTTIKGKLELAGSASITLGGTVTLDSVVNKLTSGTNAFKYSQKNNPVTLTFTGTSDLTNNLTNSNSGIALRGSTIIVGNADGTEATLTTKVIKVSGETVNYNASVEVKKGGTLNLAKVANNDNDASYIHTLTNNGTVASEKDIYVYDKVTSGANSSLTAGTLRIRNANSATSVLDGKVDIDTLKLAGGTTNIAGTVTAGCVVTDSTNADSAKTLGGTSGTLTIDSKTDSTSTANVTLTGSFGITKTGASTQELSGDTSGYSGKIAVSGGTLKVTNGIDNSAASAEVSGDGVLKITDTVTATAQSGQLGKARNVTINADAISGATSGEGEELQALGEMTGLTLDFTAAANTAVNVNVSNVTMRDVTLTNGAVTYDNAKATVATVGEKAEAPAPLVATLSDTTPATLTAMAVQKGGTAAGTLTIDLTGTLLNEYRGRTLEWTFLKGVTLQAGFTVKLGDILEGMVNENVPKVYLTVGNGTPIPLISGSTGNIDNITTATGGLLAGKSGAVDVTLTVENVPEPTTGMLSVLALAALAARRRRK